MSAQQHRGATVSLIVCDDTLWVGKWIWISFQKAVSFLFICLSAWSQKILNPEILHEKAVWIAVKAVPGFLKKRDSTKVRCISNNFWQDIRHSVGTLWSRMATRKAHREDSKSSKQIGGKSHLKGQLKTLQNTQNNKTYSAKWFLCGPVSLFSAVTL